MGSVIGIFLFGIAFTFLGIVMIKNALHDKKVCTEPAKATVVNYKAHNTKDSHGTGIHYYPLITYSAEGEEFWGELSQGKREREFDIGAQIDILYESGNPKNFVRPGIDKHPVIVPVVFTLIGLGVIVFAVLSYMGIIG